MTAIPFTEIKEKTKIIRDKDIQIDLPSVPKQYYRHGWQSWSLAAWTDLKPLPVQKPAIFHPLQVNIEHVYKSHPNGSWLGAVQFADGSILLMGALTLDTHVSLVNDVLHGKSQASETEWFISHGQEKSVFEEYTRELGKRFQSITKNVQPRVWCSWYSLYTMIDEDTLYNIFDGLEDQPFDTLQVDDGWQKKIGDWEANEKFPSGMNALAEKIKSTGRKAGLWLAPLIAAESSQLFREHQDWFLRNERGVLVSAGFNWGEPLFALDTTRPDVTAWLEALMKQVRAWGFDYLKLDFLYGGALKGKRSKDMPREAAYHQSLRVMREAMGMDAFFLTCGTPIFPALGVCDAIRVGPDVSHEWEKYRDAVLFYNPSIPATRSAIRTSLNRLWLSPLLHIDPDVAYFASKENRLAPEQKRLMQDLALICNFKATSELPQWMTEEERKQLRAFLNADPQIQQTGRYTFMIDGRAVDFTSAVELPAPPKGLTKIWGGFLGWLGSMPFILRIMNKLDDKALKKRKGRLSSK
jgi:alpha-galactosidase